MTALTKRKKVKINLLKTFILWLFSHGSNNILHRDPIYFRKIGRFVSIVWNIVVFSSVCSNVVFYSLFPSLSVSFINSLRILLCLNKNSINHTFEKWRTDQNKLMCTYNFKNFIYSLTTCRIWAGSTRLKGICTQ